MAKPSETSTSTMSDEDEGTVMRNQRSSEKAARRFLESYYTNPLQLKAQMMFKTAAESESNFIFIYLAVT